MTYLVDANVLSEPTKPQADPRVTTWLEANNESLVVDAIIMGEVWAGIVSLPDGNRKRNLEAWFQGSSSSVVCLAWTLETAIAWGELLHHVKRSGFTVGIKDTMIAATAKRHGLTVATRNVEDFTRCGVPVVNPFA